ncbi:MAG: hypothetical protein OEV23_04580 [Gallionella sp.]|nr:hypothetical protein [Gallionella sp.]
MIPVTLQPEPADFDVKVRQKGLAWLANEGIAPNSPPPRASKLPNYWSASNKQLWDAYKGECAYLAIYFEWSTGASSTDHFVAKSKKSGDAYEWDNYRLSCLGANRNKNKFDDVLDPIGLAQNTFVLNLATGNVKPNPALGATEKTAAKKTISRLKLNSAENKQMRARHYSEYLKHRHPNILKKYSPFVWYEADRQGVL